MLIFLDGLDKYGPANSVSANVIALLTQGEWTSASGSPQIVAGLSATGYALGFTATTTVTKTLAGNYSRLIGGIRFNCNLAGVNGVGVQFLDGGSNQASIVLNQTGTFSVRNGIWSSGTVLGTSTATVTASTTHALEWDISFANSASVALYLDGVSILSLSGVDTTTTANNTANGFSINSGSGTTVAFDDLFLLDTTGPAPLNAPLLTSPRIETQFPASDGAVQFAVGAGILGSSNQRATGAISPAANQFRVRAHTPTVNCTINSVSFLCFSTSATIQLRPVVYSDSSNAPGTLLSAGSTVTSMTAGAVVTLPLTTPQALTAGTRYWIGFMCDISVTNGLISFDGTTNDRTATSTFASGAPGTAPAVSASNAAVLWGNVSSVGNFYTQQQNPPQGSLSYAYDATVGHEDLYNFTTLSVVPSAIYATAIKASVSKSDAGAKTVSVRQKSGATDSAGGGGTQAPGTSFAWLTSVFPLDPNGNIAWTKAALDAAQAGVRVES